MRCCSRCSPRAASARRSSPARRGGAGAAPPARERGGQLTNAEVIALSAAHEVGVYARQAVAFVRGRGEILATTGSFHGRTFATLTATGQEKYHTGFLPLLPGIRLVPYDDLAAMEAAVRDETVAIMVEPIQGEGGVVVPAPGYLAGLRALADRRNVLLILDEIQCGLGRTGRLFAREHAGITPDIVTLAKALGGGLPIGATCTTERVA